MPSLFQGDLEHYTQEATDLKRKIVNLLKPIFDNLQFPTKELESIGVDAVRGAVYAEWHRRYRNQGLGRPIFEPPQVVIDVREE